MSRKQVNQDIRGLFYGKQSRDRNEKNVGESQPTPGTSSSRGGAIGGGGRSKPKSKKQRLSSEDIEGLMSESQSQDFLEEHPDEVTVRCDELQEVENLEHDFDAGVSREEEEALEAEGLVEEQEEAGPSFSQEDAARGLKILDDCLLGVER